MIKIYNINDFDLNILTLKPKSNHLMYFYPSPILLKTDVLKCRINKKKTKFSEYELLISGSDVDFFLSLDNMIVNLGKLNKTTWPFDTNKKIKYKSLIDSNGSVVFKIINSKDFNTLIFDEKGIVIPSSHLLDNVYAKLTFEPVGIWFNNNIFGVYLRLHEVKLDKNNSNNGQNDNGDKDDIDYILSESSLSSSVSS